MIQTVLGPIHPDEFGFVLPHEHVICDFIGADQTGPHRWDTDEVVEVMQPYLEAIRKLGVTGFVDCTPAYIGRDPEALVRLSKTTNIHILTNTGYYKEPFLPAHAFDESVDQLAARWTDELQNGIGDTGIQPGFIKIAVNPGHLIPVQQKIVRAAARTHKATRATIASHTGHGIAALEQLDLLAEEGVAPDALIVVHADSEQDSDYHLQIAERGAWVEYDSIGPKSKDRHLKLVQMMVDAGYLEQLLISHDAGWYSVREERGGEVRDFAYIPSQFVQEMLAAGLDKTVVEQITVRNPAKAFSM